MKAYNMAMFVVFINAGFAIVDAFGIFGSEISGMADIFGRLTWLTNPLVMATLAGAMAAGTIVVLNSNVITDRGIAYVTFISTFWGSVILTGIVIFGKINIPGLELFYTIYCMACALIFVNALIQMSTGGQKSHV